MRTVADKHRLVAYHNKHCWWPFRGYHFIVRLWRTFEEQIFVKITGVRPRQPAYEIKLMLSRISW